MVVSLAGFWPVISGAQPGGGIPAVIETLIDVQQTQQDIQTQGQRQLAAQEQDNELSQFIALLLEQTNNDLAGVDEKVAALGLQGEELEDSLKNHPVSWNRRLAADDRFVVLQDFFFAAVLDRETGLVWETSPDGEAREWRNAWGHCLGREIGGRKGWRLPAVEELASVVEKGSGIPTLPAGHPFDSVKNASYWSATTAAHDDILAWVVDFSTAELGLVRKGTIADDAVLPVWCVRGGRGHDGR